MKKILAIVSLVLLAACQGQGGPDASSVGSWVSNRSPATQRDAKTITTDALIFNGTGTASADTAQIQSILGNAGLSFHTVTSSELGAMSLDEIAAHGIIVWPGGTAKTMYDSLSATARANIKKAVTERGVGFVGFCAGAFIAGTYSGWGLGLATQDFPYYYLENQGVTAAMVDVSFPDQSTRSLLWYGGPTVTGFGQTIAKYKDGNAAIAQNWVGNGLVILSGPHPEGPQSWRDSFNLKDSDGLDFDLALELFRSALAQQPLGGF